MREELLQLVFPELESQGGPEGVEEERVDGDGAGDLVLPLTELGDGVEEIPLWTPDRGRIVSVETNLTMITN